MSKIYPYAGFWKRVVALIIDSFVLSIPTTLVMMPFMFHNMKDIMSIMPVSEAQPGPEVFEALIPFYMWIFLMQLVFAIIYWLYFSFMESGKTQASLGKMAMGIKVVGENGERISFGRATGRTFGKCVSYMLMYVGFLMAGFTCRKQALHDFMASTLVVDKAYQPGEALPTGKSHITALVLTVAGLLALVITPFVLLGIFVAMNASAPTNSMETLENRLAAVELYKMRAEPSQSREPFQKDDFEYYYNIDGLRAKHIPAGDFALYLPQGETTICCETLGNGTPCQNSGFADCE